MSPAMLVPPWPCGALCIALYLGLGSHAVVAPTLRGDPSRVTAPAPQRERAPLAGLRGTITHARLVERTWQIFEEDLETGRARCLSRGPVDKRYPVRTRSSDVIAHTSNQRPIVIPALGGEQRELLREMEPLRDLVVSPRDDRYVFARIRTDLVDASNLWTCDSHGAGLQMLTDEPGIQCHPAWSSDGERLAYVAGQGYGTYEIWTCDARGGDRKQLTRNTSHEFFPAFSPDGSWIAFSSDRTGDYELWAMRSDGSHERQLTHAPGLDSRPSWSPDGRSIAFTSNRSGKLEIWVLEFESATAAGLIQATEGACDPFWH